MIRTRLQGDTPFFPNMLNNGKVEVCLKEDVDKAIADLEESHKREVEQLLMEIAKLNESAQNLILDNYLKDKKLRHSNYKRCLAMAGWCEATALWCYQAAHTLPTGFHATLFGRPVMIEPDRLFDRFERLIKWSNRWMNLAKKFKPNNSTAQQGKG